MPRCRTIPDPDILDAAARIMGQVGSAKLTLALVGKEVGLSPATLLQRFGSKRGLLLGLVAASARRERARFRALREETRSPLEALQRMLMEMTAHYLPVLPADLTDRELHRQVLARSTQHLQEIARLLDEAVQAGEIVPTDTGRLAQALYATWNGAILQGMLHRGGTLDSWVKASLEVLLVPYLSQEET